MVNLLISLFISYKDFVSRKATTAASLWSEKSLREFSKEISILLLALAMPVAIMSLLVFAAYRFRKTLIMLLLFPVLIASYRANHLGGGIPSSNVDEELARQRAKELYPFVLSWMFRVLNAVSSFTGIDRKHDVHEIETASSSGDHFTWMVLLPCTNLSLNVKMRSSRIRQTDFWTSCKDTGKNTSASTLCLSVLMQ